jgi:hypothetical protein
MSTHNPNKKPRHTTISLPDMGQSARRVSHNALLRLFRHLNGPVYTSSARPSEAQRQLVVTGFILSVISILTSIFPICGLPIAICGLLIGIYGRRTSRAFHTMTSWIIALSLTGLALSLLYTIVTMSLYVHSLLR